jgi:hypothetical protein
MGAADVDVPSDGGMPPADAAPVDVGPDAAGDALPLMDAAPPTDGEPPVIDGSPPMVDGGPVDAAPPVDAQLPLESAEAIVPDPGEELAILFVGNSYTSVNALDETVCVMARQTMRFEEVICKRVTRDGWRLAQHATAAASGEELAQLLDPNDRRRIMWDVVVLQEQSQIPGFPAAQMDNQSFVEAVAELNGRIAAAEAQTALLMTWGRRDGDPRNRIFPDYPTMQTRLNQGYHRAAEAASTPERPVHVIAAGEAWRRTWQRDPEADFFRLYLNDGSHPAQPGTFLTAMVILKRAVGLSPAELSPPEGWDLDPELVARLRGDVEPPQ